MDAILELIGPLFGHWRVGVATSVSLLAAVVLAACFASFTCGYGMALLLLGFGAGMLWDADASRTKGHQRVRTPDA